MKDNPSKSPAELPTGIVLLAFSIFVIVASARMTHKGHGGFFMSPGFVPLLTGSILALLSLWYIILTLLRNSTTSPGPWMRRWLSDREKRRALIIIAITAFYAVGMLGRVPFFWATLIFHLCMFSFLRIGSPVKVAIYSLLASGLVALLLPWLFQMPVQ